MATRFGWTRRAAAALLGTLLLSVVAVPAGRAAPAPTPYPGGTWTPPPATYGVTAVKNVPVTMSDGTTLVADVYYPANPATGDRASGSFPALLTQTPYSGSIGATSVAGSTGPGDFFVTHGYVYVSADVRGTGRSVGAGQFFGPRDAQDGAELVAWASHLDGVDGRVGLHGCSYLGHTQLYTAAVLGPHSPVKAMIPGCVSSDPYRDTYMENGVPAPAWEGAGLAAGTLLGPTIEAYLVPKYAESQAGGDTAVDGTFWGDRDHLGAAEAIAATGIPALIWNGWDDSGFGGLELYSALQNAAFGRPALAPLRPDDRVTGRYQLILGDWGHGGGLDDGIQLQWYDTWIKGLATGLPTGTRTPVHVQDRTTHRWSNLSGYPFVTRVTPFRLAPDGGLRPGPPSAGADALSWGPAEQDGTSVTYTTDAFADGVTIAGPGAVQVQATTTNTDLQLRAEVFDVAPDGTAIEITHGGILGSMSRLDASRSWSDDKGRPVRPLLALTSETPVVPGLTAAYEIPLQPTLWSLAPGHGLRLRLGTLASTSLCAEKATAITTGAVGCRPRAAVMARLAGGTYAIDRSGSFLTLPLLPYGSLRATRSGVPPTGATELPLGW